MDSSTENRGPGLRAVDIFFLSFALLASGLRCFVRLHMVKAFGVDDWLMTLAMCSFTCYVSFSVAGTHFGTGRHEATLPDDDVMKAKNYWWFCFLFYSFTMITSKVSIGYSLLRIAIQRSHIWLIYGTLAVSVIAGVAFFFVTMFQCWPLSFFWDKTQDGHCVSIEVVIALAYLYSVLNVISDLILALLPGFLVWNLQLERRTKFALIPLLAMGCVASGAVIVRMAFLTKFRSPDFLFDTVDIAIWSTVEEGLAITAGSLAALRPLLRVARSKLGLHSSHRTRPSTSQAFRVSTDPSNLFNKFNGMHGEELGYIKSSTREVEEENNPKSTPANWFSTSSKNKIDAGGRKKTQDSVSMKSLHGKDSNESLNGQEDMTIMVSRSFIVSDENTR